MKAKETERKTMLTTIRHWHVPVIAVGLMIAAVVYFEHIDTKRFLQEQKVSVVNTLSTVRARLEGVINGNLLSITGLVAEFSLNPEITQEKFSRFASIILAQRTQIRNIAAARDLVITHMYPMKGNEKALGLDYRKNKEQRAAALKAKEVGGIFVAGPVNLVQGGRGFIARTPIFEAAKDKAQNRGRFWGLISTVIDVDRLYTAAGLSDPDLPIEIAIRGQDSSGAEGDIFFGRPGLFEGVPVLLDVSLPHGSWQLAAAPKGGWTHEAPNAAAIRSAGVIVLLLIIGLRIYRERQRRGKELVEKALLESEAELVNAQRVAHLGSWEWDIVNDKIERTDEALRIYGWDPQDAPFTHDAFLNSIHPDDRARIKGILYRLLEEGDSSESEFRFIRPTGEERIINEKSEVIRDASGKPIRARGIVQDITERKKMENILRNIAEGVSGATGKNFFDTLVDSLVRALDVDHAFVGRLSESGKAIQTISFFSKNKIAENFEYQLRGTPCENVVGKSLDIYEKEVAERFPEDTALKEMSIEGYAGAPLFDTSNQPLGILVVLSETPLKLPEMVQSLLLIFATRAATELEREIALEKLKGSMNEADKANRAKSEFLASMSHELRTPLNAVLGFAQMLQLNPKHPLSQIQKTHVDSILEGGNHLLELINEILDLARVEANQLDLSLEEVNANDVVADCVAMTSSVGEHRGIRTVDQFSNGPSALLRTDRLRLKQVLINLLSNAIKFNKDGGTVTVDGKETDDGFLRISVTDTGVGIKKENYASVFHMFHRLDADPMIAREGTGIGLTVTKLLVERMAGRVGFESEVEAGSTFWIELPLVSNEDVLIWTDTLRIGVDPIDKDHQILISLLNQLMRSSVGDADLDKLIEELIDYTRYHFRREETIMEVCGYSGLEKHRGHHRKLAAQVNDMADAWNKNHVSDTLHKLRMFLQTLLFSDILKADSDIAGYTKGKDQEIRKALESLE